MLFEKGNKYGKGRPKKPEIEQLRLAIKSVQKDKDFTLLEHFVEQAYKDNTVLVALMKKLVPDCKQVDLEAGESLAKAIAQAMVND